MENIANFTFHIPKMGFIVTKTGILGDLRLKIPKIEAKSANSRRIYCLSSYKKYSEFSLKPALGTNPPLESTNRNHPTPSHHAPRGSLETSQAAKTPECWGAAIALKTV